MVPMCGMFKINRDAVIDNSKKLMGVGMIVRDHEGKVLAPLYSLKQFIIDPTTAEAYAAWKAMKFSKDLGLQSAQLEGDALKIVTTLQMEG